MKNLLLITLFCVTYLGFAQCGDPLLNDFECATPAHPFDAGFIVPVTTANPGADDINASPNVGQVNDDGANAWDAVLVDYEAPIDLSVHNQLKIKVYSDDAIMIKAKVEGDAGNELEVDLGPVATGEWQELTFDFSTAAAAANTKLVLFFNFGGAEQGNIPDASNIYYIDDIVWEAAPCTSPEIANFDTCGLVHPNSKSVSLLTVANPDASGSNTSSYVGRVVDDGANPWDVVLLDYGAPIDLSTNNHLVFDVYSDDAIMVKAKIEGSMTGPAAEFDAGPLTTGEWQEVIYDFSGSVGDGNTKLVLFFNFGGDGEGHVDSATDTYYIDNLRWEPALSNNEFDIDGDVKVYPNPVSNVINIDSKINIESYKLIDITGKTILENKVDALKSLSIDVSTIKTGLYFLNVRANDAEKTFKILRE